MNVQQFCATWARFGARAALQDVVYRAACKVTEVTMLRALRLTTDTLDTSYLAVGSEHRWGFLDRRTLLRAIARDERSTLDAAFVEQALSRGDRCYGALDGDRLATYAWYSTRPTAVTVIADDVLVHFDPAWAYAYRAFTPPAYRGRRLHAAGMARALAAHVAAGHAGLACLVQSSNFAALGSSYRLGYRDVGQLFCVRIGDRRHFHATRGCVKHGFELRQADPPDPGLLPPVSGKVPIGTAARHAMNWHA